MFILYFAQKLRMETTKIGINEYLFSQYDHDVGAQNPDSCILIELIEWWTASATGCSKYQERISKS